MARTVRGSGVKEVPLSEIRDDWFEYRLEHDPRFLRCIEQARKSLRAGRGVRLEGIESEYSDTKMMVVNRAGVAR